jgi:dipeptidyl aminopeptidase/acylaminoacyl peptidase
MHTRTSMKRYVRALAAFAGFSAAFIANGQAPEVVTTFASGASSGRYAFASWTPKTLGEAMQGNKGGDTVNIVGHLFLPPGNDKVPAVVLVHGSGGIHKAEHRHPIRV